MTAAKQRLAIAVLVVPEALASELTALVESTARRTGESPEAVRRAVQIAVITRGISALKAEVG